MHLSCMLIPLFAHTECHILHAIGLLPHSSMIASLVTNQSTIHAKIRTRDGQLGIISDFSLIDCDLLQLALPLLFSELFVI